MHLKTLTLRGFKSFASATKLELEPGITCVVGPNGSGKSNVVDALAWVMGEQGAKNLRGGKMEDVIFAGTAKRQALGRAEVALTIDNSDGALPIDYTEVTISRTLFRSGGSEYRVNGEPARLLDIQELLSDSGLGKEMHVIVGQGRLDAILHADPFERRGFIEEAAGVLKHRKRKEKALRKLSGLQANLDRVADLRAELARQLGPLGRQAKAARRAQVVQAVLRDASARLLADDIVQAQARVASAQPAEDPAERRRALAEEMRLLDLRLAEAEERRRDFDRATDVLHSHRTTVASQFQRATSAAQRAGDRVRLLRSAAETQRPAGEAPEELRRRAEHVLSEHAEAESEAEARRAALAEVAEEKERVEAQLQEAEQALAAERARIAARLRRRAGLESSVEVAQRTLAHAEQAIAGLERQAAGTGEQIAAAEAQVASAQTGLAECEEGEGALDAAHEQAAAEVAEIEERHRALAAERSRVETRRVQLEARAEGQRASSRLTADLAELLTVGLPGLEGALSERLRIAPGCELAVTAALGSTAGAVVAADRAAALAVLDHVGEDGLVDVVHPFACAAADDPATPSGAGGAAPSPGLVPERAAAPGPAETVPATAVCAVAPPLPQSSHAAQPGPAQPRRGEGSPEELAASLGAVLGSTRIAGSREAALERLAEHPDEVLVLLDGSVLAAGRAARSGSPEAGRIAARAALEETEAQLRETADRLGELDGQLAQIDGPLAEARVREEAALAALHESDARIVAAGEELARTAGELERLREGAANAAAGLEEAERRRARALEELTAARDSLTEDAADDDAPDEPDTSARDALAEARQALAERSVDARVGLRAAEDRVTHLRDRAHGLRRQADQEEAARAEAARVAAARRRQAEACEQIGRIAHALAERTGRWQASAEAALAARAEERTREEEAVAELREARTAADALLSKATAEEHEAQLVRERYVLQLEELTRRAEEETGLSAENLVEQFGPHLPVPILDGPEEDGGEDEEGGEDASAEPPVRHYVRAEVLRAQKRAKKELDGIGQVNPLALEEFAALQERHDYLEKQITDIERTRAELMGLVADVDRHVQEVFEAAFADTQREFADIFSRVFPGGEGRLELTDPQDMLTTGVEVSARPAGKRVKRLSLLSGGERSLVAIAMLVAIFKARPSPFYVMDEVEAALDDVNLSRLLTIFRELQESSQLIVITHQKRTMEIADALYGVSMHGDGVSQVISQRLTRQADDRGAPAHEESPAPVQ
ncbi:chromosome segregation SMC family protein [Brevibacterium album]|uniref:chromosome segregation SMC family protein n=1 Tax=Brevibacterium album TaxID=417948 RepID=UPI000427D93E|nr:AAA family ATPase [Brevibacterium album]